MPLEAFLQLRIVLINHTRSVYSYYRQQSKHCKVLFVPDKLLPPYLVQMDIFRFRVAYHHTIFVIGAVLCQCRNILLCSLGVENNKSALNS